MSALFLSLLFVFMPTLQADDNALFAHVTLKTSKGDIQLKLFKKEAPRTVENFLGLASGSKPYRDAKDGQKVRGTPFYDGLIFHKIHPELGIQTGCPWGNGKGWPGFTIKNEKNDLKFDRPFLVAMSQIQGQDNSVGSQFFITTVPAEHLNKDHTVMGEVVAGHDVVQKISRQKRDAMMKPIKPIKLKEVVIDSE